MGYTVAVVGATGAVRDSIKLYGRINTSNR